MTDMARVEGGSRSTSGRWYVPALAGAFAFQIALLMVIGFRNGGMISPDAVAYIRVASYYLHGRLDLAVNGYWGPLLSWIMAPLLPLFADPLDAGRAAMALSGVLFLAGCVSVFRAFRLGRPALVAGTWLAALASLYWSAAHITPDLLLAGLLALGCSQVLAPSYLTRRHTQLWAGVLLGVAYLAKAIAFPFTFLFLAAMSAMQLLTRRSAVRPVARATGWTLAAFALVAAPWVVVLTAHYGTPTFSTSGAAAHAIAGPTDVQRFHPTFVSWVRPAEGRITTWEDPSLLPYRHWSPFRSFPYAFHQVSLVWDHIHQVYTFLARFDVVGIGLFALAAGLLFHRPWRANMRSHPWRWAAVPVACLAAWYLPVYFQGDGRYCWPAYPFVVSAALGMAEWLTAGEAQRGRQARAVVLAVVVIAFAAPAGPAAAVAVHGLRNGAYERAVDLQQRLDAAGVSGPIASVEGGAKIGLYLAFLRGEPWYGSNTDPSPRDISSSGASLYIVDRRSPLLPRFDAQPALQDLDGRLFSSPAEAAQCRVVVYARR